MDAEQYDRLIDDLRDLDAEQYDRLLDDLRDLRRALRLPYSALPISPRDPFLECIPRANDLRRQHLEEAARLVEQWEGYNSFVPRNIAARIRAAAQEPRA